MPLPSIVSMLDRLAGPAAGVLDRLAAPATKATAAVDKLSKALAKADGEKPLGRLKNSLDKANGAVRATFGDKAAIVLERFTKGQLNVADKAAIVQSGVSAVSKGMGAMGSVALGAASALATLGAQALGYAVAGGKMLLGMAQFRQDTQFALRFALGSSKAAQTSFAQIQSIANTLGTSAGEAMAQFRELSNGGFQQGESQLILQLAGDLKASNGGVAVALNTLSEPLQALKRNEALSIDSFKGLEAAGLSKTKVYEQLAKQLGVVVSDPNTTRIQVDRLLATQQIRGQKAVELFKKVNLSSLDEKAFGEKAKEFQDTTITGSLDKIQNRWDALMGAVNSSEAAKTVVSLLQQAAAAIDPASDSGKRFVGILDRAAAGADKALKFVGPLAAAFGGGFGEGAGKAAGLVGQLVDKLGVGQGPSANFAAALSTIGTAAGFVVVALGAVIGAAGYVVAKVAGMATAIWGAAVSIGVAVVDGMTGGLDSAKAKLVERLNALAQLLPDSVRKLLGIHSPSRVMRELGGFAGEGFSLGLEDKGKNVEAAAQSALVGPTVAAPTARPGGGRGPAGPITVNITVSGAQDAQATAKAVREEVMRLLEQLGLEMGLPEPDPT